MTFQEETFRSIRDEIQPLLVEHWQEVAHHKDKIKLDPDYRRYETMEDCGILHIVTARENGELAGYCVTFICAHLHYQKCIVGMNDLLFVVPKFRKGSVATRMIKYVEQKLMAKGCHVVNYHVKPEHDFSPLLTRNGYNIQEIILGKYIGQEA